VNAPECADAALLGATRNPDLFGRSVAITGVSDLSLLVTQERKFLGSAIMREQIARAPRDFAANVTIPLLMIHGDNAAGARRRLSIYTAPEAVTLRAGFWAHAEGSPPGLQKTRAHALVRAGVHSSKTRSKLRQDRRGPCL